MSRVAELKRDMDEAERMFHQRADELTRLANQLERAKTDGQILGDTSSLDGKVSDVKHWADRLVRLRAEHTKAEQEEARNNKTPGHGH